MQDKSKYSLALTPDHPDWPINVSSAEIPGLLVYHRPPIADNRGFFHEAVEVRDLEKVLDKKITVTQWNHSQSIPGVIRGFHAEPWEKIIYVVKGEVMAVIVDFRPDSPTFGKAQKFELGDNHRQTLYLPQGMGNSFANIGQENAEYLYMITGYFEGKPTPAVNYNDPVLTHQFGGWPIKNPIVSEKDKSYPTLKEKFGTEVDFSQFPWLQE
ncbi:MAG TPA: dTDP-4-dehydrorhamnose 3,5-epimerase family protein [Patescibacteria group bacterium]|nr:dTDP-4-dehydrorhamnose 3,5-epimerase family protein [Patescibacteria group bacterium]